MPSAQEAAGKQSAMEATLDQGIEVISAKQTVQFQQYQKIMFSVDGFVFWVATGRMMKATGSLHYSTDRLQDEDQTIGANHVLLSSEDQIAEFNLVSPTTMWLGSWPLHGGAPPLQVAFAQRGSYFEEANVWHYAGFAVYPALKSQIVHEASDLPQGPIVSDSLPLWLSQTTFFGASVPVYPAFLVPDNCAPPYIVADVQHTEPLSAAPLIGPWPGTTIPNSGASPLHQLGISQQARDTVRLTLYGFNNALAWQYLAALQEASVDGTLPFGFSNIPMIVDEKRPQAEIAALAMKKSIEIVANYNQGSADAIARRLILAASVSQFNIVGGANILGNAATAQAPQTANAAGTVG